MGSSVPKDRQHRQADHQELLGPLREHDTVRRRRAHRREVGTDPRTRSTRSASSRKIARSWPGPKAASTRRSCRSTHPILDESGNADRHAVGATATRVCARRHSKSWPRSSRCSIATRPFIRRVPSSQISDGAGAVLLTTEANAARRGGSRHAARVVDTCLVGSDPVLMLTGPIPATQRLLARNGLTIDDIDVFEINEAFASVVLAWQRGARCGSGPRQPQRWRDRARSSARRHRRDPAHQGAARTRTHRRPPGDRHHVLRRRAGHRHPHRAAVAERSGPERSYPLTILAQKR